MGTYRFILSILVALSHCDYMVCGYNLGVVAVISFFLISGFTMQILVEKHYTEIGDIHKFYIDRVIRIWPQVILYLVITMVLVVLGANNKELEETWLSNITIIGVLSHVLVLPLGYYMFLNLANGFMMPQAWTLGLEGTFYLLFPFIRKKKKFCIGLSLVIFLMAYVGLINTDWFGYRLLPGTLFVFLVGAVIADREEKYKKIVVGVIMLISIMLYVNILYVDKYNWPYNKEVLIGIIIGIPMLLLTKNIKQIAFDKLLGNLSYGIYLNHFFVMYLLPAKPSIMMERVVYIGLSIILAYLSYKFYEAPIMRWRYKIRKKYSNEKFE